MSGILRLESLTKGNTLKQGDKTPLKYRLFDADGEKLNIAGKSAKVRLVYPDFLTIGYEKGGLTVAQDDTVTFTIDSVIPSRIYHVEIIVDGQFLFPSRSDESKFTVDKSSLGTEANIIEIVGVDAVVRKAVDLINKDPSLIIDEDKLVGDIISNTGIGNINEYYQAFNDLKPKAEQSISRSLEALTKSQNALSVANGIDAKATNALSLSESADTLSKSVQDQLNELVINSGTSDAETLQARIDNKGIVHSTLKERIDVENTDITKQIKNEEKINFDYALTNIVPLNITTFEGSGDTLHPDVLYVPEGWNGYRFWMVHTPLPLYKGSYADRWECPSIAYSGNGIDWVNISLRGGKDPIIDLTEEEIQNKDYFSDPSLVLVNNVLECWYRKTSGINPKKTDIYRMVSSDGINWSEPEMVLNSQNPSNGIGGINQTFRSHQVFHIDGKYKVYYQVSGGGIKYAEIENPSNGTWSNDTITTRDINTYMWHIGMHYDKDKSEYKLVGYDNINECLHLYSSENGLNFIYEGIILQASTNSNTENLRALYQSIPVKVGDKWFLYASTTLAGSDNATTLYRTISLFIGDSLTKIRPFKGTKVISRETKFETPFLDQNRKENYYGVNMSADGTQWNGYGITTDDILNAPVWIDRTNKRPITYVFKDTSNIRPTLKPPHAGIIIINGRGNFYISVGSETDDWKKINIEDTPFTGVSINNKRVDVSSAPIIDVTGAYRVVINGGTTESISNLSGITDGQRIILLNAISSNVTIKNGMGGTGQVRLRGGTDLVLKQFDAVELIAVGTNWYQI